ncbi:antibiotic biosynthesis monooxygenase family protein [Guptibacillus hwajinpoensis]|uniref:Heme-degrading monooxygenase HmoA n=1 Tax=Guptibacillus hwajinpoensis TaxID=208199 RepID=A0ABU0K4F9_9BACL|nr:antibiotic biosynthesis monooxygenase family protein [Alkalihalobacillus hemicentroti]MDQ0483174.1 heme-degrading monooxygenase HmoA [Alkalihalobacillus hemicentroti]
MIIEKAYFVIHERLETEFEKAFSEAVELIAATNGYQHYTLTKSIEAERKYVIFIEWDSLAAHTEGFMNSQRFEQFTKKMDPYLEHVEMEHLVQIHSDK